MYWGINRRGHLFTLNLLSIIVDISILTIFLCFIMSYSQLSNSELVTSLETDIRYQGWISLNVTKSVHDWTTTSSNHGLILRVSLLDNVGQLSNHIET